MPIEAAKSERLMCPNCETEKPFFITLTTSGIYMFQCAECKEQLEHVPAITKEAVICWVQENAPFALSLVSSLFKGK